MDSTKTTFPLSDSMEKAWPVRTSFRETEYQAGLSMTASSVISGAAVASSVMASTVGVSSCIISSVAGISSVIIASVAGISWGISVAGADVAHALRLSVSTASTENKILSVFMVL